MTIENTAANAETILADFEASKVATAGRRVVDGGYMLIWDYPGSALFMGWNAEKRLPYATGFARARIFDSYDLAYDFAARNQIANGKGERPTPINAEDARKRQLADLDGVIATMRTIADAKREG